MKQLVFTLLMGVTFLSLGQSYNPDANDDGHIGSADLQSFLSVFGLPWMMENPNVCFYTDQPVHPGDPELRLIENDCDVIVNDTTAWAYCALNLDRQNPLTVINLDGYAFPWASDNPLDTSIEWPLFGMACHQCEWPSQPNSRASIVFKIEGLDQWVLFGSDHEH